MFKYYYVFEALFVSCTDILLPTFDTVADISLIISIGSNEAEEDVNRGTWIFFMLLPILLNVGVTL